ncbi:MAG: methyl-accepting chemotaxis protein [Pseudomonadota bacterium]
MKLGTKIASGFAILIVITMILGGIAVYEMRIVANDSTKLAKEYIPQIDIANQIQEAANRLMLAMSSYGFTENDSYYQEAVKEMKSLEAGLAAGDNLSASSVHLVELKGSLHQIKEAKTDYEAAMKKSSQTVALKNDLLHSMLKDADLYLKESAAFLKSQNEAFKKELSERKKMIESISKLKAIATEARELNFKAQIMNLPGLLKGAIDSLEGTNSLAEDIQTATKDQEEIGKIDLIKAFSVSYKDAMEAYLAEFQKGEDANPHVLKATGNKMTSLSGSYVTTCENFFEKQLVNLEKDMNDRHSKIIMTGAIVELCYETQLKVGGFQILRDPKMIEEAHRNFQLIEEKFVQLRKITHRETNLAHIEAVEKAAFGYKNGMEKFLEEWKALQSLGVTQEGLGNRLISVCRDLAKVGALKTIDIATNAMNGLNRASGIMVGGLLAALVASIALAVLITLSITRPIHRIIAGLLDGAEQVAAASGILSSSSQSLAGGASQQAANIEETTSSLEEVSSMARQNASNANHAQQMTKESSSVIEKANASMTRMIEAMGKVKNASMETSKVIKTIDGIAFQTNLLALNAAVEAARAGEAGAGFAVVAEEVRNLAIRASKAASNTAVMIDDTVKKVTESSNLVFDTNENFIEVAGSSVKVGELVSEIAAASKEQTLGIEQVNTAIQQMNSVTQQNAANAEECASASEELNAQAEQMKAFVAELVAMVSSKTTRNDKKIEPVLLIEP